MIYVLFIRCNLLIFDFSFMFVIVFVWGFKISSFRRVSTMVCWLKLFVVKFDDLKLVFWIYMEKGEN